mmetsp:Transcript_54569/g.117213  ORF Transcript_54569/g.117213 Transcript_54569/m.117213 type:complete len:226 (-) Transcript_54569:432-1109(-)
MILLAPSRRGALPRLLHTLVRTIALHVTGLSAPEANIRAIAGCHWRRRSLRRSQLQSGLVSQEHSHLPRQSFDQVGGHRSSVCPGDGSTSHLRVEQVRHVQEARGCSQSWKTGQPSLPVPGPPSGVFGGELEENRPSGLTSHRRFKETNCPDGPEGLGLSPQVSVRHPPRQPKQDEAAGRALVTMVRCSRGDTSIHCRVFAYQPRYGLLDLPFSLALALGRSRGG